MQEFSLKVTCAVCRKFSRRIPRSLTATNYGARASAVAWYDTVYNHDTDNRTTSSNHIPASQFSEETRKLMGRKAELLNAYVFGRFEVADLPVFLRLGRHNPLWGESLFFECNAIAGGQAPLDLIKAI
jgi:hypothetical protein